MNDHKPTHRRVYAKGFYDGLEAARDGMTPARFEANLSGQTAIAKKVFEMVPIRESWSVDQIIGELIRVNRARMDIKTVRACLGALKDAGLIKEVGRDQYRRVEVKERQPSLPDPFSSTSASEPVAGAPADIPIPSTPTAPSPASRRPIDMLAEAAASLKTVSRDILDAATNLENVALIIEEEFSTQGENVEKLKQLQSILKSLT